eukprot:5787761-Pleurochrysis_carterae.AAC.1
MNLSVSATGKVFEILGKVGVGELSASAALRRPPRALAGGATLGRKEETTSAAVSTNTDCPNAACDVARTATSLPSNSEARNGVENMP